VKRQASIWTIIVIGEVSHLMTKRKPASVGEILSEEFMEPMGLTQGALADGMGVQRKHVNELCNDRRKRDRSDRAHSCPRVRQQPGLLAECAMAQRSVGKRCTVPVSANRSNVLDH